MGIGGIGIWQLLIILAIVVLLFGTKKLKGIGSDLGGAVKGFKKAVTDEEKESDAVTDQSKDLENAQSEDATVTAETEAKEKAESK